MIACATHILPLLPFFGPPLIITAAIAGMTIMDRRRGHDEDDESEMDFAEPDRDDALPLGAPVLQ